MKQKINIFKSAFLSIFVLITGTGLAIFGLNIGTYLMNQKSAITTSIGGVVILFFIIIWLFSIDYALYKIKNDKLAKKEENNNNSMEENKSEK